MTYEDNILTGKYVLIREYMFEQIYISRLLITLSHTVNFLYNENYRKSWHHFMTIVLAVSPSVACHHV
jgi:hypothetical protein